MALWKIFEKMNLKPFHPVTNVYAVGTIVNDKEFYTASPYQINPFEQIILFTAEKVQRVNKEQFSNFEFHDAIFDDG